MKYIVTLLLLFITMGCEEIPENANPTNNTDGNTEHNSPTHQEQPNQPTLPEQPNQPTLPEQPNQPTLPEQPNQPTLPNNNARACGNTTCTGYQLCRDGVCVERANAAVADTSCNTESFLESCDGNKLVYCLDGKTEVSDCSEGGYVCALKADANLGFCVKADTRCTDTPTTVIECHDPTDVGGVAYLEYLDCALATDGKFYLFKTWKTEDCVGICADRQSCALSNEICNESSFVESCDDDVALWCTDGRVYRHNCADYGAPCFVDDNGHADCRYPF